MFGITNWVACLNGEDGPGGLPSHEILQWHLKDNWRYPQLLNSLLPWSEPTSAHLDWWQTLVSMLKGSDLHPKKAPFEPMKDTYLKHLTSKSMPLLQTKCPI